MWAVNLFGVVLFGIFSCLQLNDLDPSIYYHPSHLDAILWFLFYLLVAVLFALGTFRTVPPWLLVVAAVFCLAEMIRTAPGLYENTFGEKEFNMTQLNMSSDDPRVELSREFFGALIAMAGIAVLYFQQRRLSAS